MDNPKSIAPLMTKLVELRRLHTSKYENPQKFVICNQYTAQQLANEAQSVGKVKVEGASVLIDGLVLVVHPQDHTTDIVMEVA